jgi:hypothetical protein
VVPVLYALLFLPALVASAYVVLRWRRPRVLAETAVVKPPPAALVVTEAVPEPAAQISGEADPLQALEALLLELERATLDERDVEELERLAEQLEATARELERVP